MGPGRLICKGPKRTSWGKANVIYLIVLMISWSIHWSELNLILKMSSFLLYVNDTSLDMAFRKTILTVVTDVLRQEGDSP